MGVARRNRGAARGRTADRHTVGMEDAMGRPPKFRAAAWATAAVLGALAGLATWAANEVIVRFFGDAVRPRDLLFELLPYVRPARWLTVVALVGSLGAFLWSVRRSLVAAVPAAGAAVAILYLLRAGMIVLTPLAPAHGDGGFVFPQAQYGMFPSGHTALVTLLALLAPEGQRGLRRFAWAMVAFMVAGLVLARGHYAIDVVGGLLLAYFVANVWRHGRLFAPIGSVTGR